MKKKPAKKRRPCVAAWFVVNENGDPMVWTGARMLDWHRAKYPRASGGRAQLRLVPVKRRKP